MRPARLLQRPARFLLDRFARRTKRGRLLQTGALPWRRSDAGRVEVLLVTGRSSRRWLVPKGWPMRDRSLAEAAAQEAFEEAGVRGRVAEAIGSFGHAQNHRLLGRFQVSILVHPLAVETQLADWPERRERSRRWFGLDQAREAVASPELRRILARFAESLPEPLAR